MDPKKIQGFNFGDILDVAGDALPGDHPAYIHEDNVMGWGEATQRSNNIARALQARGAQADDKVAFLMRNCMAYSDMLAACFKARLVHVNVNYRYKAEELHYIFDNSDAMVIVFERAYATEIDQLKDRLPKVKTWIEVGEGKPELDFAESLEALAGEGDGARLEIKRDPQDLLFLYTGGTTGMPKGVMWPHATLNAIQRRGAASLGVPVPMTLDEMAIMYRENPPPNRTLPACPMMHGTGLFSAIGAMAAGGAVITMTGGKGFDAEHLWGMVDKHKPTAMAIVGDAFAKPMVAVLDANPGKYDTSSVLRITSSGVMWSYEVKRGLIKHLPQVTLQDGFSASEGIGFGSSIMTKDEEAQTAKFAIGERCRVFTERGEEVQPGSGVPGYVALGEPNPLGYYKDPEKTASTFKMINGERYSVPGDWCLVEADGSLTLLGRGSVCINTGGEKVYPEEVEEVLKTHDDVHDVLVVGVPDEKWGQAIVAVVDPEPGVDLDHSALREHVRVNLADYKVPKQIVPFRHLRAPNGKADYKGARNEAMRVLQIDTTP